MLNSPMLTAKAVVSAEDIQQTLLKGFFCEEAFYQLLALYQTTSSHEQHHTAAAVTTTKVQCPYCVRLYVSRLGLHSHLSATTVLDSVCPDWD